MTQREFLTAVKDAEVSEEIKAFAAHAIEKLDDTNKKRQEKASKKALENAPIMDQIVNDILTTEPKTASDVAAALDVSVQKASALLRAIVAEGRATQTETKVPKKGTQKAYALAQ